MKRILTIILAGTLLVACTSKEKYERLQEENENLKNELSSKDSTLTAFEESFITISQNLSLISQREKEIAMSREDLEAGRDTREEITKDIQAINSLLDENKRTIANLNKELEKYGAESSRMKNLIDQLNADIQTKEQEISYLKENLTAANFTIEILNEMLDSAEFRNEIQADLIQLQANELNRGYFAIGTFKELKDNGVVEKEGAVIGLGGSKQLKDDFNKEYFAQVDITRTRMIPLNAKKVRLVTTHPTDSYVIEGDEEKVLKILKPMEFWSANKYLVVMID